MEEAKLVCVNVPHKSSILEDFDLQICAVDQYKAGQC